MTLRSTSALLVLALLMLTAGGCVLPMAQPFTFHETAETLGRGHVGITAMGGGGANHERVADDQRGQVLPWAAGAGARVRVGVSESSDVGGDVHALWIDSSGTTVRGRPNLLGWKLSWKASLFKPLALVTSVGGSIPLGDGRATLGPDVALIGSFRVGSLSPFAGVRVGANWGLASGASATPLLGAVGAVGFAYDLLGPLRLFIEVGVPVSWVDADNSWVQSWGLYGALALALQLEP